MQQEVNLARVRGRFGAFALGDDEAFVNPGQADGGFARTFYLDGEDFSLVQTKYRLAIVRGVLFPLEERDPAGDRHGRQQRDEGRPAHPARAIAAKGGREFPPPAAAMPA